MVVTSTFGILSSSLTKNKRRLTANDNYKLILAGQNVYDYTGPIYNIKRLSDNTTLDFYDYYNNGNLVDSSNNEITTFLNNWTIDNRVIKWYDQSGNNNHAIADINYPPKILYKKGISDQGTAYSNFKLPNNTFPIGDTAFSVFTYARPPLYKIHYQSGSPLDNVLERSGDGFIRHTMNGVQLNYTWSSPMTRILVTYPGNTSKRSMYIDGIISLI